MTVMIQSDGWSDYDQSVANMIKLTLQIFNNMSSQQSEQSSMDFSVIDQKQGRQIRCDFSAQSILQKSLQLASEPNQKQKLPHHQTAFQAKIHEKAVPLQESQNTPKQFQQVSPGIYFLRDLERLERQLSFQTQFYCVYEQKSQNSLEDVLSSKSKILSPVKTTNECTNKSISKVVYPDYNYYEGELICDFQKKTNNPKPKIIKQNIKNVSRQLLSENSNLSKSKTVKDSFLSNDLKSLLSNQRKKIKSKCKMQLGNAESKSRSVNKMGVNKCKSQKSIQISTQPQGHSFKILSDYYAGDMSLHCKKVQPTKKKQFVAVLRQYDKSTKPKFMGTVLSPQSKTAAAPSKQVK